MAFTCIGEAMNPETFIPSRVSFTGSIPSQYAFPNTERTALLRSPLPEVSSLTVPSEIYLKAISGCESAAFSTAAPTAIASVVSFFRNFSLAGTLANRFSTIIVVPSDAPRSVNSPFAPPCISYMAPISASCGFEIILTSDTAQIAASASPRKPRVIILSRSAALCILLVA